MATIEHEQQATTVRVANPVADTPATNPVADTFDRAADLIERDGWFYFSGLERYDDEGFNPRCALVAIRDATGDPAGFFFETFATYLGVDDIADWNDTPGRTKAEVVTALRCAAVSAAR